MLVSRRVTLSLRTLAILYLALLLLLPLGVVGQAVLGVMLKARDRRFMLHLWSKTPKYGRCGAMCSIV